jgi:hypothetical protein
VEALLLPVMVARLVEGSREAWDCDIGVPRIGDGFSPVWFVKVFLGWACSIGSFTRNVNIQTWPLVFLQHLFPETRRRGYGWWDAEA